MYEKLGLEYKIRWMEDRLVSCRKSVEFWTSKEAELREKYGSVPTQSQCRHIKAIKTYRKEAKSELDYWLSELDKVKNKRSIYILFS